jgi:hypothetical protein
MRGGSEDFSVDEWHSIECSVCRLRAFLVVEFVTRSAEAAENNACSSLHDEYLMR